MAIEEQLSVYASFIGSLDRPVRPGNQDDQLAFIQANSEAIMADARKGYALHGRGVVILKNAGEAFLWSQYVAPEDGACDHWSEVAVELFEGYEPLTEMLFGIPRDDGGFEGFWKMQLR